MSKKVREKLAEPQHSRPDSAMVQEGERAPSFSITSDDGHQLSNTDFATRHLVLFFYPKAGTEGCTQEAADFSRLSSQFAAHGASVLGVSADSPNTLRRFRAKHTLTIALASDETHRMLEAYGVWAEKKMYGRSFMGIVRTTLLIDPGGRIGKIWRNVKVKGHAEAVLDALKSG